MKSKYIYTFLLTLALVITALAQQGAVTKLVTTPGGTINIDSNSGATNIGDIFTVGNGTALYVNDGTKTITLTAPTGGTVNVTTPQMVLSGAFVTTVQSLTDNGTVIATNALSSNSFRVTALTANVTLSNPTNSINGQRIVWEVIQNASAAKTMAFGTNFGFGAEITGCTISATLSSHNFVTAVYNSTTTKWYVVGCVTGY